jgi:hypothetical protein
MKQRKPSLRIAQLLSWADHHRARTGSYPNADSGAVLAAPTENWGAINQALLAGLRGLPGQDSLARLLYRERGRPHRRHLPALTEDDILAWAEAHHARTGTWPNQSTGRIDGAPGEAWGNVEQALRCGRRGLPGGDSLTRLLARRLGARREPARAARAPLSVDTILDWAGAYHQQTGTWPTAASPPLALPAHEHWKGIDRALRAGYRGLAGGSSLRQVLAVHAPAPPRALPAAP